MSKLEPGQQIANEDFKSSSSNNIYTTVLYDNCISCNCPAGGRKSVCKHMVSLIHSNLEVIKEKNSEFYNDLQLLLEMKNDKNKDLEKFKKLCDKLIYINRDIAEKAFENSQATNKHPERTESIRFRVTPVEKAFLRTALYDFRKYGKYNQTWDKNYTVIDFSIEDIMDYLED